MIVSRCHKNSVHVHSGGEGTSYYCCDTCHLPCDTLVPFILDDGDDNDTGSETETEAAAYQA